MRCVGCGRFDVFLCPSCAQRFLHCGFSEQPSDGIRRVFWAARWEYEAIRTLIHDLKYRSNMEVIQPFIEYATKQLALFSFDAIVPIPLHQARQRKRGFNQSEVIATAVSKKLSVPVYDQTLMRIKNTPSQAHLSASQRHKNMQDAFRVAIPLPPQVRTILLVDDVWTTGSTVASAAQILRACSNYEISAFVLAKTRVKV